MRRRFDGSAQHLAASGGVDGEHGDAQLGSRLDGGGDGVGVHPELASQFPDRWQRIAGCQGARGDGLFDARGYGLRASSGYPMLYWHVCNYVLGQY